MADKSLNIFLILLFGISAIAVLMLTWLWPITGAERVLNTLVGSVGLSVALVRTLMLKSPNVRRDDKQPVTSR